MTVTGQQISIKTGIQHTTETKGKEVMGKITLI